MGKLTHVLRWLCGVYRTRCGDVVAHGIQGQDHSTPEEQPPSGDAGDVGEDDMPFQ
jgi:hypothetical protein